MCKCHYTGRQLFTDARVDLRPSESISDGHPWKHKVGRVLDHSNITFAAREHRYQPHRRPVGRFDRSNQTGTLRYLVLDKDALKGLRVP